AQRAAVPHEGIRDPRCRGAYGAEREVGALEIRVTDEGAHPEMPVDPLERVEPGDPVDVDELCGCGEARLHHGDQALAPREEAGVVAPFTFRRDRLDDGM